MATPRLVGGRIDAFVTAAYVGDLNQLKREADVIGLNIDEVSALEGRTALQGAAECGHAEVCSFLLLAGANPNQQDARCWTPLHHAACRGHLEATRVLLQHGAIASARASRGGRRNSVCARWSLFVADALCGPTPRDCAADPAVRALLRTYERRQLCRRLLCCDTPLPTRHWRRHLRLRAEENDEPHYGCSSFTRLWLRLRRYDAPRPPDPMAFPPLVHSDSCAAAPSHVLRPLRQAGAAEGLSEDRLARRTWVRGWACRRS